MAGEIVKGAARDRIGLAIAGALAGLSLWLLIDVLDDLIDNRHLHLFVFAVAGAFFATLLAMTGPLPMRRAAPAALGVALPAAALLTWGSYRFVSLDDYLSTVHPLLAFAVITAVPLPFLIAWLRGGEAWNFYPALFNHAWNIVVRYAAAWLFVGVFWGVVYLSDALFQIVGLQIIEDLLEIDWVPYVLTGTVLGLAIAVVNELSDYVSPYLILRLLRLLLPVVLVVVPVFVAALPFRGLSGLFGGLSVAATLLAMAAGVATLVTTALDQSDEEAVASRPMRLFTQALALMLPVIAVLGAYAVWLRIAQYGWTPDRLVAACVAAFGVAYAAVYALAVLFRSGWMARIRAANVWLALALVAVAALWLTPVLNPQRISAASQLARFEAGKTPVDQLDLWEIGREWGIAGEAALARLAAMQTHPDFAALQVRLARLAEAGSKYDYTQGNTQTGQADTRAAIVAALPQRPGPAADPERASDLLTELRDFELTALRTACERRTAAGNPACVLIYLEVQPGRAGEEELLVYAQRPGNVNAIAFGSAGQGRARLDTPYTISGSGLRRMGDAAIDALIAGDYALEPARMQVLHLKDSILFIGP